MRISIDPDQNYQLKNPKKELQKLSKEKNQKRKKTNTQALTTGIKIEKKREKLKKETEKLSNQLKETTKETINLLKQKYDIEKHEIIERQLEITTKQGNTFTYNHNENDLTRYEGQPTHTKHCPNCKEKSNHTTISEKDPEFSQLEKTKHAQKHVKNNDYESVLYKCEYCKMLHKERDRKLKSSQEEYDKAKRYGELQQKLLMQAQTSVSQYLKNQIKPIQGYQEISFTISNIFQTTRTSMWATKDKIHFEDGNDIEEPKKPYTTSAISYYKSLKMKEDYKDLIDHIQLLNTWAELKILGLGITEFEEFIILEKESVLDGVYEPPLKTFGYELETVRDAARASKMIERTYKESRNESVYDKDSAAKHLERTVDEIANDEAILLKIQKDKPLRKNAE